MGSFSLTHILLLVILGIIFFGSSKLPQVGQSLGKALRGFKEGLNEIEVDPKDIQDTPEQIRTAHRKEAERTRS